MGKPKLAPGALAGTITGLFSPNKLDRGVRQAWDGLCSSGSGVPFADKRTVRFARLQAHSTGLDLQGRETKTVCRHWRVRRVD
jgi:hypothetical protein